MTLEAGDRICVICKEAPGKYKCAKCTIPFCSVLCSRTHRETPGSCNSPPPAPPPPHDCASSSQSTSTPSPPSSRKKALGSNPFSALGDSPELADLFARYPNLPDILLNIDAAMRPPTLEEQARSQAQAALSQAQSRSRGGGRGRGGRGGGGHRPPERWTNDLGIRRGKEALDRARNLSGKDGEAVRAYQALVLKLVGKQASIGGAGTNDNHRTDEEEHDVADLLRQQLDEEDARLIEDLIRAEKALDL